MTVGTKGRFFHPYTMGVMHQGVVTKVWRDGSITVKFDVTYKGKRSFRTTPEVLP